MPASSGCTVRVSLFLLLLLARSKWSIEDVDNSWRKPKQVWWAFSCCLVVSLKPRGSPRKTPIWDGRGSHLTVYMQNEHMEKLWVCSGTPGNKVAAYPWLLCSCLLHSSGWLPCWWMLMSECSSGLCIWPSYWCARLPTLANALLGDFTVRTIRFGVFRCCKVSFNGRSWYQLPFHSLLTLSAIINLATWWCLSERNVFPLHVFLDLLKFIHLMPSTPWCSGVRIQLQPRPGSMPSTPVSMSSSPGWFQRSETSWVKQGLLEVERLGI